jgi:hypothetical protein
MGSKSMARFGRPDEEGLGEIGWEELKVEKAQHQDVNGAAAGLSRWWKAGVGVARKRGRG